MRMNFFNELGISQHKLNASALIMVSCKNAVKINNSFWREINFYPVRGLLLPT
ncbi:hypothetical protein JM81_3354 [Maribacter sp. MAR_2009_72]|nr:hypothetical protein JM81_3354 [Maribacter sp. MAR_2009_72]